MKRFLRAMGYLGVWFLVTLTCAVIGAWWPMRNVDEAGAGDGMGIVMYGALGLFIGALVGILVVGHLHNVRARKR